MKIAIVAPSPVPFGLGGAERAWLGLAEAINADTEHDAELIKVPSPERNLVELLSSYRQFSTLDVSHFDLVITSKYPAWMVEHPNHVVYLFHRLRGLYDTYVGPAEPKFDHATLRRLEHAIAEPSSPARAVLDAADDAVATLGPDHPALAFPGPIARAVVHALDDRALAPERIRRYVALSDTVRQRAGYFPSGVPVEVAHLPPSPTTARASAREGIFTASRLDGPKRIDLLIAAMQHVDADIPVRIAGTGPAEPHLRELAAADPRIHFLGHLTDDELWAEYASAQAVTFFPVDEDYGLITVEAQQAATPVITCTDAGGPTELVSEQRTGRVVAPEPAAVGKAISELVAQPDHARSLGEAGRRAAEALSWDRVITTLLGTASAESDETNRRRIVVASSFVCNPPVGGGQLRCHHLYRGLADTHEVRLLSLGAYGERARTQQVEPGVVEEVIPRTWPHTAADAKYTQEAGLPVNDITTLLATGHLDEYIARLRELEPTTDAVVLAHPYLYNAVKAATPDLPIVYDAHNVEAQMKAELLPPSPIREQLLDAVAEAERAAISEAVVTVAVSEGDERALEAMNLGASIVRVENGADVAGTRFVTGAQRRENSALLRRRLAPDLAVDHVAVFVASWHPPNNEAARMLADLAPQHPEVLFILAGGHTNSLRGEVADNVLRLGIVSDLTKVGLLQAADIALNPMASGGGSNLKLVEYLASGTPVLTTALGMRGFDFADGAHLNVAPLASFGSAMRTILDDPDSAARLAAAGRASVEASYDWQRLAERFAAAITATLDS